MNFTTRIFNLMKKLYAVYDKSDFMFKISLLLTLATSVAFIAIEEILLGFWAFLVAIWVFDSMVKIYYHKVYKEYVQGSILYRKKMIRQEAEEEGVKTKHNYALAALEDLREAVDE